MGQLYSDDIADEMARHITDVIRNHDDRTALGEYEIMVFKRLAVNRFDNQEFNPLVDMIFDNLDAYEDVVLNRRYIDDNFKHNIEDILNAYLSIVLRQSNVMGELSDSEYNWCMDQIEGPVGEFILHQGSSRGGRDRGHRGRGGYVDQSRGGYQDSPRDDRYRSARGESRSGRGGYTPSRTSPPPRESPRSMLHEDDGLLAIRRAARARNEEQSESIREEPVRENRRRGAALYQDEVSNFDHVSEPVHAHAPAQELYVNKTGIEGPNHPGLDPYGDYWQDGKHYQNAVTSDWVISGEGPESLPILFDIHTEVRYLVKDAYGVVTQEIHPMTKATRYLNQTLFEDQAYRRDYYKRVDQKALRDELGLDTAEPKFGERVVPEQQYQKLGKVIQSLDPDEMAEPKAPVVADSEYIALLETKSLIEPEDPVVYKTFMIRDPIEFGSAAQVDWVNELLSGPGLSSIAQGLLENPLKIPDAPYTKLCTMISDVILDVTVHDYNSPLQAMRFPDHWIKLLEWLASKNTPEWIAAYTKELNDRIPVIFNQMPVTEYDGSVHPAFEDVVNENNKDRVIGFSKHVAIIAINYTLDELSIGQQLKDNRSISISPLTNEQESRAIYMRLRALKASATGTPFNEFILATKCGRTVRIRPNINDNGYLTLNLIKLI